MRRDTLEGSGEFVTQVTCQATLKRWQSRNHVVAERPHEFAARGERVIVDRHPFGVAGMWSGDFGSRAESPDDDRRVGSYIGVSSVGIPRGGAVQPQRKGEAPDPGGAGLRVGNFGEPFDQWQRGDAQPPWTKGRVVPRNGVSAPGFHSTTSSIFRAMARSKSVTPPAL